MIRIEETTVITAPIERCFDLARCVEVHLLDNIHFGEQALATRRPHFTACPRGGST